MKRIAGIWDLARTGGSLGTLLILLEELEIQRQIHDADVINVVIVRDAIDLVASTSSARTEAPDGQGMSDVEKLPQAFGVPRAMSGVASCHVCSDHAAIREVMSLMSTNCVIWPDLDILMRGGHSYDSTRRIQEFHARAGNIPRLSVVAEREAWAKGYVRGKARGRLPVAVHLKNNPNVPRQSNARTDSWLAFVLHCGREFPVHFFLVGDDPTDARFRGLPNVTIAQDDGITLDRYLAIIQSAELFMGMMSGPANMALFGTNPYLIFKNPDHHTREMALELGDSDHYPFALPLQRVLRTWDTTENLVAAFENVIKRGSA